MIVDLPPSASPTTAATEPDWDAIERSPDFRALVASKWRFTVPAAIFFLAYYFALPILTGYAPEFMKTPVLGPINIANIFALSQFAMVAIVMSLYVARAGSYDAQTQAIVAKIARKKT